MKEIMAIRTRFRFNLRIMREYLVITFTIILTGAVHAGTITSAGTLSDLTPPGFGTGTDVADLDAENAGRDGFVIFNSIPEGGNRSNRPWDEGIIDQKPAYVSSLDGSGSTSSGGWANYDDILIGGNTYNSGGIVNSPGAGAETAVFNFTVGAGVPADVRIGVLVNNSDSANWDATNIRLEGPAAVTADQDVPLDGGSDLVQFDISGATDGEIYTVYGTSPNSGIVIGAITFDSLVDLSDPTDSDGDTMGDVWETFYFGDLTTSDGTADGDSDGATDLEEWGALSNPTRPDTDSDGLQDGAEIKTHNTDPNDTDSDDDNLSDAFEVNGGLDPNSAAGDDGETGDPDMDGLSNLEEQGAGTLPNKDDTDEDGYLDGVENGGGFWFDENSTGTDPLNPDTDGDGLLDGVENPDENFDPGNPGTQPGTDPTLWDTDDDGVGDGSEVNNGSNPTDISSVPPPSPNVLSADFQGIPGIFPSEPVLMNGGTQNAGYLSGTWNALDITGHDGIDDNPSWTDLVNAQGNPVGVSFNVTGIISSWTNPDDPNTLNSPIYSDYLFVNAGNADPSMTWEITGLVPGSTYKFFPYGGIVRDLSMTVDTNGDGSLGDETPTRIPPQAGVEFTVTASAAGTITGSMDPGNSGEANWGGFELKGALAGGSSGLTIQTIEYDGEDVFLTWTSTPGSTYAIESSTDLENWTELQTGINAAPAPATTTSQLVDTPAEGKKFYRVTQE